MGNFVVGDEAAFSLNYSPNIQIHRYYAPKTYVPQKNLSEGSMNREKLSVWAGLCGNGSNIGPLFHENNLNFELYLAMLNNEIIPELRAAYREYFHEIWWLQAGVPA